MTIENVLSNLLREVNRLKNIVAEHDRRIVRAPLHAGASKVSTIASGAVEATRPYIHLVPESGTADTLDSITNGSDGKVIIIANSRVGDTITINPYSVGGGNIDLGGSATPYDMADVHDSITLIYREDTAHWEKIGSTAVDGGVPALHAASHQHGGSDEVATDTPAANAIPKAGASGDLDIGWINQADILTDNITTSATNNFISDAELIKLAGIEPLADVTDVANVGAAINAAAADTPLDADKFGFWDAVDSLLKSITWAGFRGLFITFTNKIAVAATATTGAALHVVRDLAAASTDSPVVDIVQDNVGDDQAALRVQQDGTGKLISAFDGASEAFAIADGGGMTLPLIAAKTTPVDADGVLLRDSAASSVVKETTWANIKALLKTYFDTLYATLNGFSGARVYHNANQSISDSTFTVLAFNSERYDTSGFHDTVTNNGRLTAPIAGKYLIIGMVAFESGTGLRGIQIRLNGTTTIGSNFVTAVAAGAGSSTDLFVMSEYELAATNYVELIAWQNSGSAKTVYFAGNSTPEFSMSLRNSP